MLRFSEYAFTGVILYLTLKNIKIYKNVGVATKAPPCFNLAQNGHFLGHGWSDFYETFESGFFDFKQIHNSTKTSKISCKNKIFGPNCHFQTRPNTPLPDLVFRAALSHFFPDFNKKSVKMLSGSYCIILAGTLRNLKHDPCITDHYFKLRNGYQTPKWPSFYL